MKSTVCVVGLGYIGLSTAALIASSGFSVNGYDISQRVTEIISSGKSHFIEKDLNDLVKRVVSSGALRATNRIIQSDVYIICVPTPITKNKEPDVTYVISAAKEIARVLKPGDLVILESTCPVGTTRHIEAIFRDLCKHLKFVSDCEGECDVSIGYCPERVLPGNILFELTNNKRIVGGLSVACSNKIKLFFEKFVHGSVTTVTSPEVAEMVKLAENSYRDVNVAFANELSMIAADIGVNVWEIIDNANVHPRVNILEPGTGVGGHCIAIDPWFLYFSAPHVAQLTKTAREVNTAKTYWVLQEINKKIKQIKNNKGLKKISVLVYGLTYKPDVDDLRESPALWLAQKLSRQEDVILTAIDPLLNHSQKSFTKLNFSNSEAQGLYDLEVLLVAHKSFKNFLFGDQFLSFTRHIS